MRRTVVGITAFLALTGTLQVLPVYAAPVAQAHPVEPSMDELSLGSVVDPDEDAVVVSDGQVVADGVPLTDGVEPTDDPPATPEAADPTGAAEDTSSSPEAGGTTSATPTTGAPTTGAPTTSAPTTGGATPDVDVVTSGAEVAGIPALTLSAPTTDEFSTLGVTWTQADVFDVVVQVRTVGDDGNWSAWSTLDVDDVEQSAPDGTVDPDVRGGTAPSWTGPATGVEVIVQGLTVVPEDVRLTLIDPGTSRADTLPVGQGPTGQAHAGVNQPAIFSRAQWGADESIRGWDPEYAPTIKAATLHHTDDRNTYTADDVPGMMRAIYAFHSVTRGWGDIGYNFVVDRFGRTFEGRYGGTSSTVIGAHAGGFNQGTVGVAMLGNFTSTDPPAAMLEAVADVMAWKLSLYGVNPYGTTQLTSAGGGTSRYAAGVVVTLPTIFAHRDVGATTCPGQAAYNRMGQLRDMVAARFSGLGGSPVGNLENFTVRGGSVVVEGWTYDPDRPSASIDVGVSVDGSWAQNTPADQDRPDVGSAFPQAGSRHGFAAQIPVAAGSHTVCVVFVNIAPSGANTWANCRTVVIARADANTPIGNVDEVRVSGRQLMARGWTVDPDARTSALQVDVYVNGALVQSAPAGESRPDVAAVYPAAGAAHGWSWSTTASRPGPYRVCVYATNLNAGGGDTLLTCTTLVVGAEQFQPVGNTDVARISGRTITFDGWAFDPDDPTAPVMVVVFLDGRLEWATWTGASRPDVGAAFPAAGNQRGYSLSRQVGPGPHTACAFAVNVGAGTANTPMGCVWGTVSPQAFEPVGHLDGATVASPGVITIGGWVWDSDTGSAPSPFNLYVDGRLVPGVTASVDRPDLAAALPPEAGTAHGFAPTLNVGVGSHSVCAFAVNAGIGSTNPFLGCFRVTA